MWAPHHLEQQPRRRQSGGIAPCKGATRRRHAVRRLRMAQNPHRYQYRARCRGGRARLGRRWVAETRQLHTPSGATAKQISPNKNHAAPLRYKTLPARAARPHFRDKTLPAHPLAPLVRYKTLPARPFSPHVRYKTLPAHPKWLDLALFRHAGRVLYRCHHQEAKQGEFCTERKAETRLANTTAHQAPPVWRVPEGPVWRAPEGPEGTGGLRGTEPGRGAGGRWWSPAAVPTNNSNTPPRQISHVISDGHFLRLPKNVAIPTR